MIITDRVPILFGIAVVYFGFRPATPTAITAFFLVIAVLRTPDSWPPKAPIPAR